MEEMIFPMGSVPVSVAAKVYGKDACWVRAGIISGWLPIGKATRNGKEITSLDEMDSRRGRINFYISPKKLWEHTGFVWRGAHKFVQRPLRRIRIGFRSIAITSSNIL